MKKLTKGLFTTPIYYVNGTPHIGHLHTQFLTESVALWWTMKRNKNEEKKFFFSTGTDEHGLKIEKEAKKNNKNPQEFCDEISKNFKHVFDFYKIKYTNFIRTTDEEHKITIEEIWSSLKKDIYFGKYEGWYCISDESFVTNVIKTETGEVLSLESNKPCEWVVEENFKFNIKKYKEKVHNWLLENPDVIKPKSKYLEALKIIDDVFKEDLSISRSIERVEWGIKVPNFENQVIYVWVEALFNYFTTGRKLKIWPPEYQVLGKDILKFHALIWPALLFSVNLELPKNLLIHSHWTVNNIKISKSLGNFVDPKEIGEKYGIDYVKYFLLRQSNLSHDSDFSEKDLQIHVNELSNNLGNLLKRTFALKLHNEEDNKITFKNITKSDKELIETINQLSKKVIHFYDNCDFRQGILTIMEILDKGNQHFSLEKTYKCRGERLSTLKYIIAEILRISGIGLYPILPEKMIELLKYINKENDCLENEMKFKIDSNYQIEFNPPLLFRKIKK